MSRLPQPGGDSGNWGAILNDYLSVAHTSSGALSSGSVGQAQLSSGAVATSAIADAAVTVPKLSNDVQATITTAAKRDTVGSPNGIASLGADGKIPSSELPAQTTTTVQTPPATQGSLGTVQLAGDISGSATAPTVNKINGIAISGSATSGNVLIATSPSSAMWQTPTQNGGTIWRTTSTPTNAKSGDVWVDTTSDPTGVRLKVLIGNTWTSIGLAEQSSTPQNPTPTKTITASVIDNKNGTATLSWTANFTPTSGIWSVSRDGTDSTGSGPWSGTVSSSMNSQMFSNLMAGQSYNLSVSADGITATQRITMSTPPAPSTVYKNGTYTASASYSVPHGNTNDLSVNLTITNDKITSISATHNTSDGESSYYVGEFDNALAGSATNQSIQSYSPSQIGGASLTTGGFNSVLDTIRATAKN